MLINSMPMTSLCVFCGSSPGADPAYIQSAQRLGRVLAEQRIRLVYGGASVGVMGALADTVLADGGEVIGVIPRGLQQREVGHRGLSELHVVESMHERKALMAELADAFVVLPGGLGTLEELFEVWTWALLGIHGKPCGMLNVRGYFNSLLSFLDHAVAEGFVRGVHRSMLLVDTDPTLLVTRLREYRPPALPRWLDREQT